jgi:hypothetical protein
LKIGIITFHAAPNHGAALQAFALQSHLKKSGHDTFFINYQLGGGVRPSGLMRWISRTPAATIEKVKHQFRLSPFLRFQEKFLNIGEQKYLDHVQLQNDPPIADAYVCGSDQIWNPGFIKANTDEHVYWLEFASSEKRCIAYAASFGVSKLEEEIKSRYASYSKKFLSIGVREQDAVLLMQTLSRNDAVWVPDPTLLLCRSEYEIVMPKKNKLKANYLFSYILGSDNSKISMLVNAAVIGIMKINKYDAYRGSLIHNVLRRGYIGPSEWLANLRESSCVITNSFHATVFSLLFHKLFIVLLRSGKDSGMNNRVNSLLQVVGLQHRAINVYDINNIEELCQEDIDWSQVDKKIQRFRDTGAKFLKIALS